MSANLQADRSKEAPSARSRNARGEGERLRPALMQAAAELLLEHGSADRLSIRAITARAGVSPTALYLQFADKQELVQAVSDEALEELTAYMRSASASKEEPRGQLEAIGLAYVRFAEERPGLYRILFATPGRQSKSDAPPRERPGADAFDEFLLSTERNLPVGADPLAVALQLWAGLHGYVSLRQTNPVFAWPGPEEFVAHLYEAHVGRVR